MKSANENNLLPRVIVKSKPVDIYQILEECRHTENAIEVSVMFISLFGNCTSVAEKAPNDQSFQQF